MTRQPVDECVCYVVPERFWFKHFGAVEPGSQLEPNYRCRVHFPIAVGDIVYVMPSRILRWRVAYVGPYSSEVVSPDGTVRMTLWGGDLELIHARQLFQVQRVHGPLPGTWLWRMEGNSLSHTYTTWHAALAAADYQRKLEYMRLRNPL